MGLDFSSFLRGEHTAIVPQRNILSYKGTIFHQRTKENGVLIVAGEDICDDETAVNADMFIPDRDKSLHFNWKCTNPEVRLDSLVATGIEVNYPREDAVAGGITLSNEQLKKTCNYANET